ncbi:unnamed protein product [Symbiodinium necroappetens]|uniref:Uncharacterized protein n=1 Tax=Symbiodinium necroappetens TaxID=1628268 RepID=A0A812ZSH3_9DINO|nr:unnamed protein product [Symbiodinium necroappetens]
MARSCRSATGPRGWRSSRPKATCRSPSGTTSPGSPGPMGTTRSSRRSRPSSGSPFQPAPEEHLALISTSSTASISTTSRRQTTFAWPRSS